MRDAQMQPLRELLAKKSKKNQMNPGNKACIPLESLGRIAAFQGVMANPNKKIPALASGCGGPSQGREPLSLSGARQA
jgi:hypothetical protein